MSYGERVRIFLIQTMTSKKKKVPASGASSSFSSSVSPLSSTLLSMANYFGADTIRLKQIAIADADADITKV